MAELPPLDDSRLPAGIRARFVAGVNGLRVHLLEAGFAVRKRPCVLLLHGFPEIAYSWRRIMVPLAEAGFHVVAPDQRGYGRTTGWNADYDGDLRPFSILNAVRDALALVSALGHRSVAAVVGHDFGASVAAWCALVRPDVFRSVTLMSAPFAGPPALPFDTAEAPPAAAAPHDIHQALAALDRPRKHYQWYYSTRPANDDMWHCPQGVHAFMRGYFHYKSADWQGNRPYPLKSWSAEELARMPTYYIMDRDRNMAETVVPVMPSAAEIAACRLAARQRARGLCRRIRAQRFSGRAQLVPQPDDRAFRRRIAVVFGADDRRAVDVYCRRERLGHLPAPRQFRAHADHRLHRYGRLPSGRRRRPLGPAGAA